MRGGIRSGEGVAREPDGGEAEFGFVERAEVVGEDFDFGEFACERGDLLGNGGELEKTGLGRKAQEGPACQDRGGFRSLINQALTSRALLV